MAKRKKGSGTGQAVPTPYDDSKWRAEDDHRTLSRAAEIHSDPSRIAGVRKHHVEQTRNLKAMDMALGGNKIRGDKNYKKLMSSLGRGKA